MRSLFVNSLPRVALIDCVHAVSLLSLWYRHNACHEPLGGRRSALVQVNTKPSPGPHVNESGWWTTRLHEGAASTTTVPSTRAGGGGARGGSGVLLPPSSSAPGSGVLSVVGSAIQSGTSPSPLNRKGLPTLPLNEPSSSCLSPSLANSSTDESLLECSESDFSSAPSALTCLIDFLFWFKFV